MTSGIGTGGTSFRSFEYVISVYYAPLKVRRGHGDGLIRGLGMREIR